MTCNCDEHAHVVKPTPHGPELVCMRCGRATFVRLEAAATRAEKNAKALAWIAGASFIVFVMFVVLL